VSHTRDNRTLEKIVALDGVSLIGKSQDLALSLRCDSAVVWLDPRGGIRKGDRPRPPYYGDLATGVRHIDFRSIRGIYAEGDVHLQLEGNVLRAERLYFDTVGNRILIVQGFVSTLLSQGRFNEGGPPIPFLARARELRIQLKKQVRDGRSFSSSISGIRGKGASVTSCDFGVPHYHIHARELAVEPHDDEFMTVALEGATLNIQEFPVFYLPYLWGRTSILKYFPLRHLSVGSNSRFGGYVETRWKDEIRLKGKDGRDRKWGTWELFLDNYTRRGFGQGLEIEYETEDYRGIVSGYYIRDDSTDLTRKLKVVPPDIDRGRFRAFHRQFLPAGLQLDVEGSWIRDRNFLYEYFEREARAEKAQENYVRLIRDWDNFTVRGLYRFRVNEFFTRTEYVPRLSGNLFSQPVVPGGFLGTNLYLDLDAEATQGRIRYDEALNLRDRSTSRGDVLASLELPIKIGPVCINPFFAGQYTAWSESMDEPIANNGNFYQDSGSVDRNAWTMGIRLHTQFWKTYEKAFFGMDVRHLVVPEAFYSNTYDVSLESQRIIPLDEKDRVNEFEAITVRLQNKLQVKQGKTALDFLELNTEMVFYPEEERDNLGRAEGPLFIDLKAGVAPFILLADTLIDWEEDDAVITNIGVLGGLGKIPGLEKSNALFYVGHRFAKKLSNVFTGGLEARLGKKWSVGGYYQYDYRNGAPLYQKYVIGRNFHRFRLELEFYDDGGSGDHGFRIAFAPVEFFQKISRKRWQRAQGQYWGDY